jgi:hypothetical protein
LTLAAMTRHDEFWIARRDNRQVAATTVGSSCRHEFSVKRRCRRPLPKDQFRPIAPMSAACGIA